MVRRKEKEKKNRNLIMHMNLSRTKKQMCEGKREGNKERERR